MISLAELKEALKLGADTSEDGYLGRCEQAAVRYVEAVTGRYFGVPTARTEYFQTYGQPTIWLSETPTGAVTVTADGVAVDAADFSVRGRVLKHDSGWGHASGVEIAVTYTAGYAAGQEPADIRLAVIQLVGHWMENREGVVVGTITKEMEFGVRDLLSPWRKVAV